MGISERKYTDEWLAEQNAKENTPVEYNGKEYTVYEATQRQRRLESTMRAQREKIRLLEEGNANEDSIIAATAGYFKTSDEYVRFSKAMDLPQQRERVTIDGKGRISNKLVEKSAESGIMKSGSDNMAEIFQLGKIDTKPLETEFGKLKTDEIIITNERIDHIKSRHPEDFWLFEEYGVQTVKNPDIIIKDCKNKGTVFMVKKLPDTNLNVVARLVIDGDNENLKNSVMTFYRIRNRNLIKLANKNKTLYKKE